MQSSNVIGAYESKTKFSELLERVEKGAEITVTRHGMPVARLVPVRMEAAWRGHEQSGPTLPQVEARPPSDQRERPKQKVAVPPPKFCRCAGPTA